MSNTVSHILGEMEGGIQRCIICSEIIIDYRNVMYPKDQGPPVPWQTGMMFVKKNDDGIVTNLYSLNAIPPAEPFLPCNYKEEKK